MKSVIALVLGLGAALLADGCSPQAETSGTNTNWLRRCESDAECGDEARCLCGRCTTACDASASCRSGSVCTEELQSVVQCQGEATRTCQPACADDAGCESDRRCLDGTCVDPLSTSCPAGALYCEDFERELTDPTLVVTEGNALTRSEVVTPSGSFALRATIDGGPSTAYLRAPLEPALSSGGLFLSGWVRVPTEAAYNVAPLALWSADEEDWALRLTLQDARLDVWSKTTPLTSSHQLTRGEWYCLGLELTIGDSPDGSVAISVNDQQVAAASSIDTLPDGGIQAVTAGVLWANSPAEVLVDRVIVSRERIPCF